MSHVSDQHKLSPAQRAEALVAYLEEKAHLPDDIPDELKPKALQTDIEAALIEMEQAAQDRMKPK
jgi:hypothetical protein